RGRSSVCLEPRPQGLEIVDDLSDKYGRAIYLERVDNSPAIGWPQAIDQGEQTPIFLAGPAGQQVHHDGASVGIQRVIGLDALLADGPEQLVRAAKFLTIHERLAGSVGVAHTLDERCRAKMRRRSAIGSSHETVAGDRKSTRLNSSHDQISY